jgi:hypothetical protein
MRVAMRVGLRVVSQHTLPGLPLSATSSASGLDIGHARGSQVFSGSAGV